MKLPKEIANAAFWMIVAAVAVIVVLVSYNYTQSGKFNFGSLSICGILLLVAYMAKINAATK